MSNLVSIKGGSAEQLTYETMLLDHLKTLSAEQKNMKMFSGIMCCDTDEGVVFVNLVGGNTILETLGLLEVCKHTILDSD